MIVLDASALIEVLLRTRVGAAIERRMFAPGETLHAPHLIDIETTQVLRSHVAKGAIDPKRGREAIQDVATLALRRYGHESLLPRVWEMRDQSDRLRRGVRRACAGAGRSPSHLRPPPRRLGGPSRADRADVRAPLAVVHSEGPPHP